jgi:cyclophilin family peptidyl-prolyl cis-trans isomerase
MFLRRITRLLLTSSLALLVVTMIGCGGGENSQKPSVNATVTTPEPVSYKVKSRFIITGSDLRSVLVSLDDPFGEGVCTELDEIARNGNSIVIECIPQRRTVDFNVYSSDLVLLRSLSVQVVEPDIQFQSVTPSSEVTIGAESEFTLNGEYLSGFWIVLPESTGCEELSSVSISDDEKSLVIKCIPTTRQPTFIVTARKDLREIARSTANLSTAGVAPTNPTAIYADISTVLNQPNKFTIEAGFIGLTTPQVTADACDSISIDSESSTFRKLVLTCTPSALTVNFDIKDLNNPGDDDTTTLASLLPSRVLMTTSQGEIVIALQNQRAPISVANFIQYVNDGFYDGTIFHRVLTQDTTTDSLGINQGGGFASKADFLDGTDKPGLRDPIALETTTATGLSNVAGTIAMARLGTSTSSATSQFYFNVSNNTALDAVNQNGAGYAVFGQVITGLDVLTAINTVPRTTGNEALPENDVVIQSVVQTQ